MARSFDVQEFASDASSHKTITVDKILKKRKRSVNRQEKRNVSLTDRILRERLQLSSARKAWSRESKESKTSELALSAFADVKLSEANLVSAQVSKEAMDKYPPLRK